MANVDAEAKTILATPRKASHFRRTLRIALILIGTHVLVWAAGRGQGWWATRIVEEKVERVSSELSQARDLVLRFEARRSLERAQTALDARNFGIAQEQVLAASRLVKASHPTAELATLTDALSRYQPQVTENLAAQHQQLDAWLAQLDASIPTQKADSTATAP